jgi:hypothetical protein
VKLLLQIWKRKSDGKSNYFRKGLRKLGKEISKSRNSIKFLQKPKSVNISKRCDKLAQCGILPLVKSGSNCGRSVELV